MNKTKRVAWHKHLKTAKRAKDRAREASRAQAQAARGASGVHAHPTAARTSRTASATRAAAPKP
ncbi:MAG TPA: hypothetical protein VGR57_11760 [Ktedonobacterales bacterium]|nr:hypothetical protein [Ktedonobacterales bacterium]